MFGFLAHSCLALAKGPLPGLNLGKVDKGLLSREGQIVSSPLARFALLNLAF
uniref:Uncharacterized protein n=1 Tax=Arundo donax TaxID=35708 RepID=A0A0A9EL26_ARUDO